MSYARRLAGIDETTLRLEHLRVRTRYHQGAINPVERAIQRFGARHIPSTSWTYGSSASATAFDRSRTSARTATPVRENSRTTAEPLRPAAPVTRIMQSSIAMDAYAL